MGFVVFRNAKNEESSKLDSSPYGADGRIRTGDLILTKEDFSEQ